MSYRRWVVIFAPAIAVVSVAVALALLAGRAPVEEPSRDAVAPRANSTGIDMVALPGGEFVMGAVAGDAAAASNERPARTVRIAPFEISRHEITQAQWLAVTGKNPARFKDPRRPVEQVSWLDAQTFIQALNRLEGGARYRLPTEAEWEYAARAGTAGRYYFGDDAAAADRHAWFGATTESGTRAVGGRQPNAWGLFDMAGNVWEWVQDCWHDTYEGAPADGSVFGGGDCRLRVVRGGAWDSAPAFLRASVRGSLDASLGDINVGLRIARDR